ncbi:hypothetical protein Patl1_33616 [Pistacia atlantica]|uniref:Uncharacterized protein n=1 Tax=Pistacia atlantica TaxID=434234 RepID=A0ACC0ZQI0_9ROSI|nr:hypothetical protein Patl1_33616 [Pistacia atlantica]
MVVASLIAQMSFQVATNPPGGFWQVDTKRFDEGLPWGPGTCKAGTPVLAYTSKVINTCLQPAAPFLLWHHSA